MTQCCSHDTVPPLCVWVGVWVWLHHPSPFISYTELSYEQILAWTPRSNHHQASPPTPRGALTPSPDKELATTGAQGIGSPSVDAGGGPPVTATPAQEQQTGAGVGGGPAGVAEGPGGVTSTTAAEKTVPPAAGASAAEGGPATGPHGVPTGNATTATVSGHRKVCAIHVHTHTHAHTRTHTHTHTPQGVGCVLCRSPLSLAVTLCCERVYAIPG